MRVLPLTLAALYVATAPSTAWAAGQDPKGNNGTVKIDGAPFDSSRGNEPHVGCSFHLTFWGFDTGQTATITFTGQAPTKAGTLLTQKGVTISDDAAGGGQDQDAVLAYTAEQLGLSDITPAKQGWHVKVAVDVDGAPGGAKQKVFWLSCPGAAPERTTAPTPVPTTETTAPTSGGGGSGTVRTEATATPAEAPVTGSGSGGGDVTTSTPLPPAYGGGTLSGAGGGRLAGQSAAASLPFTGDQTGNLMLLGAGAVATGTALTVVARRRRTS